MPSTRPFRFGVQLSGAASREEWVAKARRAEALGYSTISIPDHFGEQLAPTVALMAAADATERIRIGALVFDNDYRHPVVLAKECATLDLLSEGRLELGIGAGWMRTDYDQSGIAYDPPGVRIDRFEEGLAILNGCFGEGPFDFAGKHYRVTGYDGLPKPVQQPRPPILIGGGSRRVLGIAGREADIVGINPRLTAGEVGPDAAKDASPEATERKIGWVRESAGARFADIELNVLTFFTIITDDRKAMAEQLAGGFGLSADEALQVPHVAVGTVDQIVDDLQARRERYGFSYVTFQGDGMETMAPIVERLTGT